MWCTVIFYFENFLKVIVYNMVCCKMYKKILAILESGEAMTQKEIGERLPGINRAVLLGYLRCLVDLGKIRSKDSGKAKIYFA